MLEELKELGVEAGYDAYRIKIGEGDQFGVTCSLNQTRNSSYSWISQERKRFGLEVS